MIPIFYFLGLCTEFPPDHKWFNELCQEEYHAKHNQAGDDFNYDQFLVAVSKVHCVKIINNGQTCVRE